MIKNTFIAEKDENTEVKEGVMIRIYKSSKTDPDLPARPAGGHPWNSLSGEGTFSPVVFCNTSFQVFGRPNIIFLQTLANRI